MISAFRFSVSCYKKKKERKRMGKADDILISSFQQQQHYSSLNSVSPTVESVSSCP